MRFQVAWLRPCIRTTASRGDVASQAGGTLLRLVHHDVDQAMFALERQRRCPFSLVLPRRVAKLNRHQRVAHDSGAVLDETARVAA